jgi:hypothetical protein
MCDAPSQPCPLTQYPASQYTQHRKGLLRSATCLSCTRSMSAPPLSPSPTPSPPLSTHPASSDDSSSGHVPAAQVAVIPALAPFSLTIWWQDQSAGLRFGESAAVYLPPPPTYLSFCPLSSSLNCGLSLMKADSLATPCVNTGVKGAEPDCVGVCEAERCRYVHSPQPLVFLML